MTNLDSILKSKDMTLSTKVHLVKAMVFPVVMYGSESWTIKKAECRRTNTFWTMVLGKTLQSPLDCRKVQPVHPRRDQAWVFLGRADVEAEPEYFGHLMRRANSFEKTQMLGKIEGRRGRWQKRMKWLDGIIDSMDMGLGKLPDLRRTGRPGVLQFMGSQRVVHNWVTELNWTELQEIW